MEEFIEKLKELPREIQVWVNWHVASFSERSTLTEIDCLNGIIHWTKNCSSKKGTIYELYAYCDHEGSLTNDIEKAAYKSVILFNVLLSKISLSVIGMSKLDIENNPFTKEALNSITNIRSINEVIQKTKLGSKEEMKKAKREMRKVRLSIYISRPAITQSLFLLWKLRDQWPGAAVTISKLLYDIATRQYSSVRSA